MKRTGKMFWMTGLAALAGLSVVACSTPVSTQTPGSSVSLSDYDAIKAQLAAKEQAIAAEAVSREEAVAKLKTQADQLKAQLAGIVPATVIQAGQLQPVPVGQQPSGWDTTESLRAGLKLVATYDSNGPDAWDVAKHPTVYFTSEGGTNLFGGLHIIDAYSKEVVASVNYDLGAKVSPHTVGVSPDGKWAYLQGGRLVDGKTEDVTLIINARTLKIAKILKQESRFQGSMRVQRLHHVMGFIDSKGNDRLVLQYGFGSNGGPHFVLDPKNDNKVVMAITVEDTGYWMGHPFLTVDPTGKYLYVGLKMAAWQEATKEIGGIAKINLETRAVTVIPGVGEHLIGMAHTADGKFTFVIDGEGSLVYKIDNATNTVVGHASAGVAGPYGIALNWDETELFTVGKGEGSHNSGSVLGVVDIKNGAFTPKRGIVNPISLAGTGKVASIDHAFLHPDPKVNELWISNMAGDETIVLDLATRTVKTYIPTPHGGNTHSGAFVQYKTDWTGKVLADHSGPKGDMMATRLAMTKAAAAAVPAK